MLDKHHAQINIAIVNGLMLIPKAPFVIFTPAWLAIDAGSIIGSYIPDLDSQSSHIRRKLIIGRHIHTTHRGILHSYLLWLPLTLIYLLSTLKTFNSNDIFLKFIIGFIYGVLFGIIGHIFEDGFSVAGISWFYPITAYDQTMLAKHNTIMRKPSYYRKIKVKNKDNYVEIKHVPVRHWWGRGYKTGKRFEKDLAKFCSGINILETILLILKII